MSPSKTFVIKGSVLGDGHHRDCFADMQYCMDADGNEYDDFTRTVAARLFALASMFPDLTGHQLRKIATERWCFSKTDPDRPFDHSVSVHPYPRQGSPFWDEYQMRMKRGE